MLALNQTRAYYIVSEGRIFEINPIDPLTELEGVTIHNNHNQINYHLYFY